MALPLILETAKKSLGAARKTEQYTHTGQSGRVYKSDHPITEAERKQIDRYDEEVEQPKRSKSFRYPAPIGPVKPKKNEGIGNMLSAGMYAMRQDEIRRGNPNYVGSEEQTQEFYTDFGKLPTVEQKAKAKATEARKNARSPLNGSLPMQIARGLSKQGAGMAASALSTLGGGGPLDSRIREEINRSPIAEFGKYLVPVVGQAAMTESVARGAVEALDELGKGHPERAGMELLNNAILPGALHGIANVALPKIVKAWKAFRAGGKAEDFVTEAVTAGMRVEDAQKLAKFEPKEMPGYDAGHAPKLTDQAQRPFGIDVTDEVASRKALPAPGTTSKTKGDIPSAFGGVTEASLRGMGKPRVPTNQESILRQIDRESTVGASIPRPPSAIPPKKRIEAPASEAKAFQMPPSPATASPEVSVPKVSQGVAHAEVDSLRSEMGWKPRESTVKTDAELAQDAKKYAGKEFAVADRVIKDSKVSLSDEESVALGTRLKSLKDEMLQAKAKNDVEAFDLADEEAQRIADALDASGSRQGRAFRARRFLFDGQEDAWTLNRRAKKANLDQPLDAKKQGEFDSIVSKLEKANADLKAERDAAIKNLELFKGAQLSKRAKGPLTAERRRAEALSSLRKLGIPVAEDVGNVAPTSGGMRSKQSGAINIPEGSTEQVARGVRSLVRSYADEGIENWNQLLGRLQKDLPGIDEEQALFILSGKYKVAKVEADVNRMRANGFLNQVKSDAEFRAKTPFMKLVSGALQGVNTTQRSLQTTLDNSMALIQGKNVLTWKPGTWFKSVGTSLKAFATKDPIGFARKEAAEIQNHPLYAKAVQAKLGLSDIDGAFSKQEEFFAGHLENHIPGLSHSKAAATTLMNKMRFDLFRKLAANAPENAPAEFYEDIARQINIATGKGSGRTAEWLGSKQGGALLYAPRYTYSKFQHNLGVLTLGGAKTTAGKIESLKMYATQAASYIALARTAQLFGFDVELDPRSNDFGTARAADGSYSIDLFRQQSEGIRFFAQMLYGRVSKKGNYKDPGAYGAYSLGDYLENKLSAGARTAKMLTTGTTYDDVEGGQRTATASDFWKSYIPLSVKEMYKNRSVPGTFPLSFIGGNVDQPIARSAKKLPPPLKLLPPPGLKRMLEGDKSRT